jgi:hypothetical protein
VESCEIFTRQIKDEVIGNHTYQLLARSQREGEESMSRDPNAKTFGQKMECFEKTLKQFLDSEALKECIIAHLCHTRAWHYNHQTLKVELLPGGKWIVQSDHSWSQNGSCVVTLTQANYHFRKMEEIGESRDFEDILQSSADESREVAEKLYAHQEECIKQGTLKQFAWMRERGYLD